MSKVIDIKDIHDKDLRKVINFLLDQKVCVISYSIDIDIKHFFHVLIVFFYGEGYTINISLVHKSLRKFLLEPNKAHSVIRIYPLPINNQG